MKIYTRTGDCGSTGLFGGTRVSKDDDRIDAYGTVDELNALLGCARAHQPGSRIDGQIKTIQAELFSLGAELATPEPQKHDMDVLEEAHILQLETWIDEHQKTLPPLKNFILPDGHLAAAQLHVARAVCRRAERCIVTLIRRSDASVSNNGLIYLNRLGDLLFVLARVANHENQYPETKWQRPRPEKSCVETAKTPRN